MRCAALGTRSTWIVQLIVWKEVHCARHCLCPRRDRRVCGRRVGRSGGGEAVIVFDGIAIALAVAALVYLVFALVKPEKF